MSKDEFFIFNIPMIKRGEEYCTTFLFYSKGGFIPLVKEKIIRMNKFSSFNKFLEYCELHSIKVIAVCDNKRINRLIQWQVSKRSSLEIDIDTFNFFVENREGIVKESVKDFAEIIGV